MGGQRLDAGAVDVLAECLVIGKRLDPGGVGRVGFDYESAEEQLPSQDGMGEHMTAETGHCAFRFGVAVNMDACAQTGKGATLPEPSDQGAANVAPAETGTLRDLDPRACVPNPWNRKRFPKKPLQELARSIKSEGLVQPIVVRPQEDGKWQIVAGERRWRAVTINKADTIRAIVRDDLDDAAVRRMCLTENIHREDLHPMDEAQLIADLTADDTPLKEIAARLGRPIQYVLRRRSLLDLTPRLRKCFDMTHNPLPLTVAEELARWPAEIQEEAVGDTTQAWFSWPAPGELREDLHRRYTFRLDTAPWELTDATLDPDVGPCQGCPSTTEARAELFAEYKKDASCLNAICWKRKLVRHLTRLMDEHEAVPICEDEWCSDPAWKKVALLRHQYVPAERPKCEYRVRALYVVGVKKLGKLTYICRDKKCTTHKDGGVPHGNAYDEEQKAKAKLTRAIRKEFEPMVKEAMKKVGARPPQEVLGFAVRRVVDQLGYDVRRELGDVLELREDGEKASEFNAQVKDRLDDYMDGLTTQAEWNALLVAAMLCVSRPGTWQARRDEARLTGVSTHLGVELLPPSFREYLKTAPKKDLNDFDDDDLDDFNEEDGDGENDE